MSDEQTAVAQWFLLSTLKCLWARHCCFSRSWRKPSRGCTSCNSWRSSTCQKSMMVHFYTAIVESILTSSITIWYAAATAKDKGRLQCIIRSAEKVIGCSLPSLQDLYASRTCTPPGSWGRRKDCGRPLPPRTRRPNSNPILAPSHSVMECNYVWSHTRGCGGSLIYRGGYKFTGKFPFSALSPFSDRNRRGYCN